MALKNINPTKTSAWKELTKHFNDIQNINIKNLDKEVNRKEDFSLIFDDL
jgi:glucose-6-phosphate isomerase